MFSSNEPFHSKLYLGNQCKLVLPSTVIVGQPNYFHISIQSLVGQYIFPTNLWLNVTPFQPLFSLLNLFLYQTFGVSFRFLLSKSRNILRKYFFGQLISVKLVLGIFLSSLPLYSNYKSTSGYIYLKLKLRYPPLHDACTLITSFPTSAWLPIRHQAPRLVLLSILTLHPLCSVRHQKMLTLFFFKCLGYRLGPKWYKPANIYCCSIYCPLPRHYCHCDWIRWLPRTPPPLLLMPNQISKIHSGT